MSLYPDDLCRAFAQPGRVFVLTGAGVSAESGIPTFRGAEGVWRQFNPMELASAEGFARNPARCWQWYLERRANVRQAKPNAAHLALARLERAAGAMMIATQNVDGLHQRAGSQNVEEIHGSLWRTRCTVTGREFEDGECVIEGGPLPPVGPEGHLLRPAIVWFGELLPTAPLVRVEEFLSRRVDLTLVIGTTAAFPYIVQWALQARAHGGFLVEINLEPTDLTPFTDHFLQGKAGEILSRLVA